MNPTFTTSKLDRLVLVALQLSWCNRESVSIYHDIGVGPSSNLPWNIMKSASLWDKQCDISTFLDYVSRNSYIHSKWKKKPSWILTNKEQACSVITSRKMFYRFSDQMIMHLKWSIKFDEDFKISQCKKWTRWGKISNLHSFISPRETGPACLYRRRINHTQIHYIYCDVMYQNWTAWYR